MSIDEHARARAFASIVKPHLVKYAPRTLVELCAGDGKGGAQFDDAGIDKIVFVDTKRVRKFSENTAHLKTPFTQVIGSLEDVDLPHLSWVIALHACGRLTDTIIERAVAANTYLAVMPCCYGQNMKRYGLRALSSRRKLEYPNEQTYYDSIRVDFLREQGYQAFIEKIDPKITPMNNVIIGFPPLPF